MLTTINIADFLLRHKVISGEQMSFDIYRVNTVSGKMTIFCEGYFDSGVITTMIVVMVIKIFIRSDAYTR